MPLHKTTPARKRQDNAERTPRPALLPAQPTTGRGIIEIRKYPNRRYYDTSSSTHLTLEDIRHLVRNGATVQILDSQTGADITSKILMQIILEFDSPKLDLLTAPFLTEMIRVNDQVLLGFFEKFFHQALTSFIGFQNHLQRQMRTGSLLPSLFPTVNPWPNAPEETAPGQKLAAETNGHASEQDVRGTLHQLKAQIAALEKSVQRPLTRKKNALNR